ncbi:MAG: response regulator, partial [Psychrosphaera sp.]|nr:response regulator [Psychrosphaera sp.]
MKVVAKILVVDDEPEICMVLCKILVKEGYQAEQACNGLEALEKWRNKANTNEAYDLLIVDLKMPKMDGVTLLGEIRKTDALLPVIVLTGHADLDDAYTLLTDHQIADFHNKPLKNRRSF